MPSEFDALTAGVGYGGLTDRSQIHIALCFILETAGCPLSDEGITKLLCDNELANYFEVRDAISLMDERGYISPVTYCGRACYEVTDKGSNAAELLSSYLPVVFRSRVVKLALDTAARERRLEGVDAEINGASDGGVNLTMTIKDRAGEPMMSFTMYMGNTAQAEVLRDRFLENPAAMYAAITEAMLGDK